VFVCLFFPFLGFFFFFFRFKDLFLFKKSIWKICKICIVIFFFFHGSVIYSRQLRVHMIRDRDSCTRCRYSRVYRSFGDFNIAAIIEPRFLQCVSVDRAKLPPFQVWLRKRRLQSGDRLVHICNRLARKCLARKCLRRSIVRSNRARHS